jgi:hypothetical protein
MEKTERLGILIPLAPSSPVATQQRPHFSTGHLVPFTFLSHSFSVLQVQKHQPHLLNQTWGGKGSLLQGGGRVEASSLLASLTLLTPLLNSVTTSLNHFFLESPCCYSKLANMEYAFDVGMVHCLAVFIFQLSTSFLYEAFPTQHKIPIKHVFSPTRL